jgi:hypothetical protein
MAGICGIQKKMASENRSQFEDVVVVCGAAGIFFKSFYY